MLIFWIVCLSLEVLLVLAYAATPAKIPISNFLNHDLTIRFGAPAVKVGIAWMFLAACRYKILSPYDFAESVAQYQMLPAWSVNGFSLFMPMLELVTAVGILFTKWTKEFTFLFIVMMVMFIIALGQALIRDLGIVCGCFDIVDAHSKHSAWESLIRDVVLMGPLVWLWLKGGNRWIWDFRKTVVSGENLVKSKK